MRQSKFTDRKGLRGRGATGKMVVFGLLKRHGKVYTRPVPCDPGDAARCNPPEVAPGAMIYSDQLSSYDA